ncbi:hypothetical protein NJC40_03390 [Pseudomonas sp. 21LCFQ02]|uniref:hypothetical protein n=1 Tax=Pseudomonas sp. 21LCFQ02 TaxID=2957505 RepID=UPI00209AF626|nr:hypothetical protein [Pseudomonas sp. 21LCFQ02]MCO8166821.1 hypothetical protein [Pseudomonas sp. 21LCFQ02]
MDDWINSSQFWASSIVSGLVGMAITFLLARAKAPVYKLLSGAKGRIKEFARGRRYKALKAAKAIRFDSAQIYRKIALSYCLLGLFIVSIGAMPASLAFAPPVIHQDKLASALYMSFTGIPMLVLEFAWLNASSNVTLLLKLRGKIKRKSGRMV